jgi:hypothetical protein
MRLLAALASGIRGAENGSVGIYVRGTATFAQVFTDYDGTGAQTPAAALPLDANGGAVWYVNQPVLCICRDANGTPVRQFTDMETATDVEVISRSFTGTNYTTGASGFSLPTLLSSVLDRWFTSAGAIDFNVLGGGVVRTIQAALGAVSNLFFNVTDAAYGAIGNGIADDRGAIQSAITAANAVGGWVYFPPGTYLIGSPGLTVNGAAGFLGPHGALVTSTSSGMTQLTIAAGSNGKFEIIGISFAGSGVTSAWMKLNAGDLLMVDVVAALTYTTTVVAAFIDLTAGTGDAITAIGCKFTVPMSIASVAPFNGRTVALIYCEFDFVLSTGLPTINPLRVTDGIIAGCDFTSTNSLQMYIERVGGATQALAVIGSDFAAPSTGAIQAGILDVTGGVGVFEAGNTFGAAMAPVVFSGYTDINASWGVSRSTEARQTFATDNGAAVTLDVNYGSWRIRRTTNAAQTITVPIPKFPGQVMRLEIINDAGVNVPAINIVTVKGLTGAATPIITTGQRYTLTAVATLTATALQWVITNGPTGVAWT